MGIAGALWLAPLAAGEAQAGERLPADQRPATWDMTVEELEEIGLGQYRGDPVPVPEQFPKYNTEPRPVEGAGPPDPWLIFVNFDGATLTPGMDDAKNNVTQIPNLVGEFAPYGEGAMRDAVMQAVATDWAAYNMLVVDERPASGEYVMNMTGPTNPFGGGVLGIAPVDCFNMQTHSNITYAFHSANDGFSAAITATTIGQEVAHSFGLEHVDEPNDIMNPYNAGGDPTFIDQCIQVVGQIACIDQHQEHCEGFAQNAHQELLSLFGPAYVDDTPPSVTIISPFDGMEFAEAPATVPVNVNVTDDVGVTGVTLRNNGVVVSTLTEAPWQWTLENLPEGVWTLEVTAVDPSGNEGMSAPASVIVGLPGGSGGEEETDSAGGNPFPDGDEGCGCRQGSPAGPVEVAGLALLVLGLRRRRR